MPKFSPRSGKVTKQQKKLEKQLEKEVKEITKKAPDFKMSAICFTLNNYTWQEELCLLCNSEPITYVIFGYELGENKTPHLQGYMEANYSMRFTTWKNVPGLERAHIEKRHGTQEEAIKYCTKEGNFMEWGEKKVSRQGQRFDLDDARECARDHGMRNVTCWGNLQEIRVAEKYLEYNDEADENSRPVVTWLYGKTGCGKSRMAKRMYPDAYIKKDASKWWCGYDGHENVIMDDFRGHWMPFSSLLTLLDYGGAKLEVKGSRRQFKAKNVIITSSKHPKDVYNFDELNDDVAQLIRRIDFIQCLDKPAPAREVEGNTDNLDLDHGIKLSFD